MAFTAMRWAWEQETSAGAKYVLLALADYADEAGICFPSQKTLAQKCGLSRSTINVHLQTLAKQGLVCVERQHRSSGYRRASQYRLVMNQSPNIQRRNIGSQRLKSGQDPVRNHGCVVMTAAEVAALLAEKALSVAQMLLPEGKQENKVWQVALTERRYEIVVEGDQKGQWIISDNKQTGDLIDLWCIIRKISLAEAVFAAKQWLGIDKFQFCLDGKQYRIMRVR